MERTLAKEISENPCGSSNREGFGEFAPIRMIVRIGKKQRYPHEEPKRHEHDGKQASSEKRHPIRNQSHGREGEENSCDYGPEHLTGRKPLRDENGGSVKIKRLFESKGRGADAEKNAADAIQRLK